MWLLSPSAQCSQLTSRCQSSQGLGPFVPVSALERNFPALLHSAHSPLAPLKLPTERPPPASFPRGPFPRLHPLTVQTDSSILSAHAPTCFPRVKHRVRRGVTIGFLLCNLLESCLTNKMPFSRPLHADALSEA